MMDSGLIVNGKIVTDSSVFIGDVAFIDGVIIETGSLDRKKYHQLQQVDATGKYVVPGGIDPHVHLALPTPAGPSSDDFVTGSKAALAGGTTTLFDFVTPKKGESLPDALAQRKEEASHSLTDCHLHVGISAFHGNTKSEILYCIEKEGIKSFKTYLAYRETIGISVAELREVMEIVGPAGGLVLVHCEDGEMIGSLQQQLLKEGKTAAYYHPVAHPPEAEIKAIEDVIMLCKMTGCPAYIVHTSTGRGTELIRQAKQSGLPVFGETCTQYLIFDDSVYNPNLDPLKILPFIISPPIRSISDQKALWNGLANGTFDTLATDHCPFNTIGQKDKGLQNFTRIPNGTGGIEYRLRLLFTYGVASGLISMNQWVALTSTNAARIFGLNKKGKIEPGFDADIVILNPETDGYIDKKMQAQRCDSNIYDGLKFQGNIEWVFHKKTQ